MGRHSRQGASAAARQSPLTAARKAGVVAVMAAGVLAGSGFWQSAVAATAPHSCDDQEEVEPPAPSHGSNHGVLIIDNSNADSWLEVDRTLNTLIQSEGTAGSDHDGDGGDVEVSREPAGSPGAPGASAQPTTSEGDD